VTDQPAEARAVDAAAQDAQAEERRDARAACRESLTLVVAALERLETEAHASGDAGLETWAALMAERAHHRWVKIR